MDHQHSNRRSLTSIEYIAEMDKLMNVVENSVNEVTRVAKKTKFNLYDKSGGYFCLQEMMTKDLGIHIYPDRFFGGRPLKSEKRRRIAQLSATEGALRLRDHAEHELSSQSRRPHLGQWGGAVRGISSLIGGEFIFSFAGFPEMISEALMLLVAVRWKCMTMEHAKELATISKVSDKGNTFFLENDWDM